MLTATKPLGAVSHGPSSLTTSTVSAAGQWAPRRGVSKVSRSTRISAAVSEVATVNGQVPGTSVVHELTTTGLLLAPKVTVKVHLKGEDSTNEKVAGMVHSPWLYLDFFSSQLDIETGKEKHTGPHQVVYSGMDAGTGDLVFEVPFTVPSSFGPIGAVMVENRYNTEVFVSDIKLQYRLLGASDDAVTSFHCNSWVTYHSGHNKRVFFPLKSSYLPSETPHGVQRLRKMDLEAIRGGDGGDGERMAWERVYDYDVYNDLGDPDTDPAMKRPVLGGEERPYPRRCRTGRPRCKTDPSSQTRPKGGDDDIYVPRDEAFTERKAGAFTTKKVLSGLAALTTKQKASGDEQRSFPSMADIDALYEDGYRNQPGQQEDTSLQSYFEGLRDEVLKHLVEGETGQVVEDIRRVFKFQTPEIHDKDKLAWFRDEEFARQTLAGMNPLSIQLVTEVPIKSKLDVETYGPGDSLITENLIEKQINGVMKAQEEISLIPGELNTALDYHDMFLPYVHAVREIEHTTLYASRTVFFLTEDGTLQPIAIELTRPKSTNLPQWRHVFTPGTSVRDSWLWQLAKTHVLAHDTGYHQLISHWLRTHCCVEPYVIAASRQLSRMHPVYQLLHPHFRFTMEINAQARGMLINAGGVIESSFSPGKLCMELSSGIYDKFWQFDMEALPADLIKRGMAYHVDGDRNKLELTIKDYPYANDGLLVWSSIKEWVSDYVKHFYPTAADITGDGELQEFWTEVRTKGHADKQDESWWPTLNSHESLVQTLTTIIWVASGHHAAVNFGQYPYAGYFPNRPTIARRNMPTEGCEEEEIRLFEQDPVKVLLDTLPSQYQTTLVLPTLNLLSSHSPGEEYMGTHSEPAWMEDPEVRAAFVRFNARMKEIAEKIDALNKDKKLRNRQGPGVVPYVLLKPNYGNPGDMMSVMEMGIPNSISI